MNGSYQHGEDAGERIGIAVVTANEAYDRAHRKGVRPGIGFYAHFLKPFIRREVLLAIRERSRTVERSEAKEELTLEQELMELNTQIEDRLHGRETL